MQIRPPRRAQSRSSPPRSLSRLKRTNPTSNRNLDPRILPSASPRKHRRTNLSPNRLPIPNRNRDRPLSRYPSMSLLRARSPRPRPPRYPSPSSRRFPRTTPSTLRSRSSAPARSCTNFQHIFPTGPMRSVSPANTTGSPASAAPSKQAATVPPSPCAIRKTASGTRSRFASAETPAAPVPPGPSTRSRNQTNSKTRRTPQKRSPRF